MKRFRLDVHASERDLHDKIAGDVRRGLTSTPKFLLPKYFYDERGSQLFEQITELPEYYLTRTERSLLSAKASELIDLVRPYEMVELGSGSSSKTRLLLDAASHNGSLVRYIPFDVSPAIVESAAGALLEEYPSLEVHGVIGDFERHLPQVPTARGRRLVLFLGSTIGNLDPEERGRLLVDIGKLLGPGDRLLLGVDLVKDVATLEAAYNDAAGVSAEFNRNVLHVINGALHADFNPGEFQHRAHYNHDKARMEMHLAPRSPQSVFIKDLDLRVVINPDETIHTENSHKFTRDTAEELLEEAGMCLAYWCTDADNMYGLALAAAAS